MKKILLPLILFLLLLSMPFSLKAAEYTYDNDIENQNGFEIVKLVVGEGEDTTFTLTVKQGEEEKTFDGTYVVDTETGVYTLTSNGETPKTLEVVLDNETGKFSFYEEELPPIEKKVYTCTDELMTGILTLVSDGTFVLEIIESGVKTEEVGTYVVNEGYITITTEKESLDLELDKTNMTFKEYEKVEEIIYPAKVVHSQYLYGDVLTDIEGGNIGDIVTIYAKPYSLCKVIKVSVNGNELTPTEEGNYQFSLNEGENLIEATFEIDQEQMKYIVDMITNAKEGNWEEIFSIKNLFTIISWVISALMGGGFLITWLKTKKVESNTKVNVVDEVKQVLNNNNAEVVKNFLEKTLQPLVNNIKADNVATKEVVSTLARCFMLSQENTPESRLAIINELTKVQSSSSDLAQQVKDLIDLEILKANQEKESKKQVIEELEKVNESLSVETTKEKDDEMKGRY